jgi:hypothetical protein
MFFKTEFKSMKLLKVIDMKNEKPHWAEKFKKVSHVFKMASYTF